MADRMDYTEEQRALLKQKGIFPYDWFNSSEKLEHPNLPERKTFESVLRNEACSEEDYARAQRVWQAFGHKKFVDCLSLYLAGMFSCQVPLPLSR